MNGTAAEHLKVEPPPAMERGALCNLAFICAAPAEAYGFCARHRDEAGERARAYREEQHQSQRAHWLEEVGLPRLYWRATFTDSRPTAAVKAAQAWRDARGFAHGRLLVLGGPTGVGKTWALACILNEVLAFYPTTMRFVLSSSVARQLCDFKDGDDRMDELVHARLLLLDDLQSPGRPEALTALEELLVRRHGERRPTLISTNMTRRQFIEVLGDRVGDRLVDWGGFVELPGRSLRGSSA